MHKWIVAALALCGINHWATAPSNKPASNAPSPTIEPSQQAPVQLAWLDSDGSPWPPPPPRPTPPCCQ